MGHLNYYYGLRVKSDNFYYVILPLFLSKSRPCAEMVGPRKEFEEDLITSRSALKDCFYAIFRFDTLALSYFNFKISCQK